MRHYLVPLLQKFRSKGARKNILYYFSQILMLASPILVLPYLGRVVGPAGIGLYGSGQALALLVTTFVEFNMLLSGARRAARVRNDAPLLHQLVRDVFGVKLISTVCTVTVCMGLFVVVPIMRGDVAVFAMAILLGVIQGNTVYWFFGGTGNLQFVAFTDVLGRLLGVVAVFIFVHGPSQLWLALLAQASGAGVGLLAAVTFMLTRFTGPVLPDIAGGARLMRGTLDLFFQNVVGNLYTSSTALLMGFVTVPVTIGFFSAAERMMRGATLPSAPIRQTFFPRVSAMVHEDASRSIQEVRKLLMVACAFNLCIALLLFFFSDNIIHVIFGNRFPLSGMVLKILAPLPLLYIFADVLGNLWLIPLHHDRFCSIVVSISGILHVAGVLVMTIFWGAVGAAIAMLAANFFAATLIVLKVVSLPIHPFLRSKALTQR